MRPFAWLERRAEPVAGFTLLEVLVALAVAGAIFAVVAEFAGRALRNWNRGEATIAAMEMVTRGLGRLGADLTLAVPMSPPGSDNSTVYFIGDPSRLLFVAATGFGAGDRGLELLNVAAVNERDDLILVRHRGPVANPPPPLRDPVVLLRGRIGLRFSYRDRDGRTVATWTNRRELPAAVVVELFGLAQTPLFPVPLILPIAVNFSADCLDSPEGGEKPPRCLDRSAESQQAPATQRRP